MFTRAMQINYEAYQVIYREFILNGQVFIINFIKIYDSESVILLIYFISEY